VVRQEISAVLTDLRNRLEEERRRIGAEIGTYPPPIAGCDVQFNHLLEERARIGRALRAVDTLLGESRSDRVDMQAAEVLIAMPELVDPELMRVLRRAAGQAPG